MLRCDVWTFFFFLVYEFCGIGSKDRDWDV